MDYILKRGPGFRMAILRRNKWLSFVVLVSAAAVLYWLMTDFDPIASFSRHRDEVAHTHLIIPHANETAYQPVSQSTPNISRTVTKGVQRLTPIVYSEPCSGTINDSRRTTLFHDYDKVQHYINDLFGNLSDINALPKDADPVFITGVSSNHLHESLDMFENFNSVVRKMKPKLRMIFYDLGLQAGEPEKIKSICQCEYRLFPFERFPDHVKPLKGYAFKPLAIMMVLKEYPFALWMDSSIRFKQSNISRLFDMARRLDVICVAGGGSVALRTLPATFEYFGEQPCTFRNLSEIQAGFSISRTTPFVVENILKPWIACALLIDCMVPHDGWSKYFDCGRNGNVYGDCHRYDQSIWSIVLYRAYGYDVFKRMQRFEGEFVKLPWLQINL